MAARGCLPRTLLRDEIERYRDDLGLQVNAAFEHEFNLHAGFAEHWRFPSKPSVRAEFGGWLLSALRAGGVEPEMFLPNTASINTKSPAGRRSAWRRRIVR
jgi:glutamine synthetase